MAAFPVTIITNGFPVSITNPQEIDVFLAVGQSNIEGFSEGLSNSPIPVDGNLKYFNNEIVPNSDPQMIGGTGGSAMPAFGNTYKLLTGKNICIINAAKGGTSLLAVNDTGNGNWSTTGTLFSASITKLNTGITKLEEKGFIPIVKGILWGQGEGDATGVNANSSVETEYKDAIKNLIVRYRTNIDTSLPFYLFRTGVFAYATPTDTFQKVRLQQEIAISESTNAYVIYRKAVNFGFDDRSLLKPDNLHYLQLGYNEMGVEGAINVLQRKSYQEESHGIGYNVKSSPLKGFEQNSATLTNNNSKGIAITPTINQSSTASYTAWWLSAYRFLTGSSGKYLMDVGTNTAADGTGTHSTKFRVDEDGNTSVNGHIEPRNATSQNLGSGILQWANVIGAIHTAIASVVIRAGALANSIQFQLGSTEIARFSPTNGNLLINTTTDNNVSKLQVNGSINVILPIYADNTAAASLPIGTQYRTVTGEVRIKI